MNSLPNGMKPLLVAGLVSCSYLTGCGGSHVVNVLGSYFPVWLLCMLLGVAAAFGARALFLRFKIEPYVGPLPLTYLSVVVAVSCLAWLLIS